MLFNINVSLKNPVQLWLYTELSWIVFLCVVWPACTAARVDSSRHRNMFILVYCHVNIFARLKLAEQFHIYTVGSVFILYDRKVFSYLKVWWYQWAGGRLCCFSEYRNRKFYVCCKLFEILHFNYFFVEVDVAWLYFMLIWLSFFIFSIYCVALEICSTVNFV